MKKIYIILAILFSFNLNSQITGEVKYIVKSIDFVTKDKNIDIENTLSAAEKQIFLLRFNNNLNSEFKLLNNLSNEDSKLNEFYFKMASIRFTCDFEYYQDNQTRKEFFKKDDGNIIKGELLNKTWVITSETKMIDNYICYKAEYNYQYTGRDNKTKTRNIIAWFAPSLPFSYGPKNYYGLPGLILELQDWDTTFLATKIELFDKEIEIDLPKGKTITQEEYERKVLSGN